jgi:hypothetical protein
MYVLHVSRDSEGIEPNLAVSGQIGKVFVELPSWSFRTALPAVFEYLNVSITSSHVG